MNEFDRDELKAVLTEIDEEAYLALGASERKRIVIVGGSAFILDRLTRRSVTADVDILSADDDLMAILAQHPEVNSQVNVYADRLPQGFANRLVRLPIDTRLVDFFRPCLEDLTVMKLYSWRKQDRPAI